MIGYFIRPIVCFFKCAIITGLIFPLNAYSGEIQEKRAFQYEAAAYFWGPQVKGTTSSGQTITMPFSDIIKDLRFGYMGAFKAFKGDWSFVSDVIYLDLKKDKSSTIPVPLSNGQGITVFGNADVKLTGWLLNLNAAYKLFENEHFIAHGLAGARYLELDANTTLRLDALGYTHAASVNLSGSTWDAIGGIAGLVKINKQWSVPYYIDAGAGQSKFTWQGYTGLSYALSWGSIDLLYRYSSWKFKQGALLQDINFGGPLLGVVYKFQ